MDQYIGKMLNNRYEILERIGTGGMAVVYKAKCHYLNRLVAIKILKSDLAQDEDFRRRFNAESQAVAQLSHPNIVSVYDVSKGGDTEYIVMELVDGITLKQYMEKRGQLDWRESLHFITQIMRGLSHAHGRGIVHRDIKPQNIMVLRDGSVKVTDFGIACLENSAQTLTQEALGSVHYISPEQAKGDRTDARSDIYSAGVVLYEMLSNRLPFEGDSAVSVAIQHLSSIPLAPREINPNIPAQLELICMKAMAPDLDRRYASAEEMISDLEIFRKNPGVNLDFSMEDLRPEESDEPTRPIKTAHVAAATAAVAKQRQTVRTERQYDAREEVEERGHRKGQLGLVIGGLLMAAVAIGLLFNYILSTFGAETESYIVPKIIGYSVEDAKDLPSIKGIFTIEVGRTEPSEEYGAGIILEQDPSPDSTRKSNVVITVVVSSGKDNGQMIDVVGQEARQAEKVLLNDLKNTYDLVIKQTLEFSDEYNEGYVMATDPVAGETLKKGDTVTLTVSKGPQTTTVPNFVGQNIDKVKAQLESAWNLGTGGKVELVDSEEDAGIILWQSISDTTVVDVGTNIDFRVSSGLASTQPTPEDGQDKTIGIPLPTDRDIVELRVDMDGKKIYENQLDCSRGSVQVPLNASGMVTITYYWDGEKQDTMQVQLP